MLEGHGPHVEAGGGPPQLAGLAGHEADERRAGQLLGRHHPRAGAGHPGYGG